MSDLNCTTEGLLAFQTWRNINALVWNDSQFLEYSCKLEQYLKLRDLCASVESHLLIVCGTLGFVGAFFMILTLRQLNFRPSPDFVLFRVVGYLEMIQMFVMTSMAASGFCKCEESHVCSFVWAHLSTTVQNICADTVDLIVLFLCVERSVACLSPQHFKMLRTNGLRRLVIFGSLALPCVFSIVQAMEIRVIYDHALNRYTDIPSDFSKTPIYQYFLFGNMIRLYATAILIASATLCSVIGFIKAAKRRARLQRQKFEFELTTTPALISEDATQMEKSISLHRLSEAFTWRRHTVIDPKKIDKKSRELDLCCLQLCLASPIVINQILYASGLESNNTFVLGKSVFENDLTLDQAFVELEKAEYFTVLRTFTNISNLLAHALHFYLYLIFSMKVRRDFLAMLKSW